MKPRLVRGGRQPGTRWLGALFVSLGIVPTTYSQSPDSFNPGADSGIGTVVLQADGKVLVAGSFSQLAGKPRPRLGRLNADGTVDSSFNPQLGGVAAPSVSCLALQEEDKLLVGGTFTSPDGEHHNISRLHRDGTPDAAFKADADGPVRCFAIQTDGRILVGGEFKTLCGQSRSYVGRLNPDGGLDAAFNAVADGSVTVLALQTDHRILMAGNFLKLGGQPRYALGRLNPDGNCDTAFAPTVAALSPALQPSGHVSSILPLPNGKIVVGGSFLQLDGRARNRVGRLNADGSLDVSFIPDVNFPLDGKEYTPYVALQTDGKVLIGSMTTSGNLSDCFLQRLNSDGSWDETFASPAVRGGFGLQSMESGRNLSWIPTGLLALALQPDGRILVGGIFATLGGQNRRNIGRLNNIGPATSVLARSGPVLTWLRTGTGPELREVTFEVCTNGLDWSWLGPVARTADGWQFSGVVAPTNASFRASGYVVTGSQNDWLVRTTLGPPVISSQPLDATNQAGTMAEFEVMGSGSEPLSYQWLKDGRSISDEITAVGTTGPSLTLSNVLQAEAGGYSVVLANSFASVTSQVARLTVFDPTILQQPDFAAAELGSEVMFTVVATGTEPLHYQWRRGDLPLPGATDASLRLTNVQVADADSQYNVQVSNPVGTVTSQGAALIPITSQLMPEAFTPPPDGLVAAVAVVPNGRFLAAGSFYSLAGQNRPFLGRLNYDGSLDAGFAPQLNKAALCLAVQADGRVIVGGLFSRLGGQNRKSVARLNLDGSLDTTFWFDADSDILAIALQTDGKILVGGQFGTVADYVRQRLCRLNTDGSIDTTFWADADGTVETLALQMDGKILVGGSFKTLGGLPRSCLARLNPDGSVDHSFDPGPDSPVAALAVQPDGKIVVAGDFHKLAGQARNRLGRVDAEGRLDSSFNPEPDGSVYTVALQANGKILVGGWFNKLGSVVSAYLCRLNADGTPDGSFIPGTSASAWVNAPVSSLAIQEDGKILVAGKFTSLAGQACAGLGRLANAGSVTQSLTWRGSTITWLRSGNCPELSQTTFAFSTNNTDWARLGSGRRVPGGWEFMAGPAPTTGTVRARGLVVNGGQAGGLVELTAPFSTNVLRILTDDGRLGFVPNRFGFSISGPAGQVVVVERSDTLATWIPVLTNTLEGGPWYFSDPTPSTARSRYYRARQ